MAKVEEMGNEQLVGPAFNGDMSCIEELAKRGSVAVSETEVERKLKGSQLYGYPTIADSDSVTVRNGKVVSVNGNPYP